MNTDNNHLMRMFADEAKLIPDSWISEAQQRLADLARLGYTPVPEELQHAADFALGGQDETVISMHSGGKLSRWAAGERKKKRAKEKQARKQRKAQRRGRS